MMASDYELMTDVEIDFEGKRIRGRYRVMNGSVIVYYIDDLKFADQGMTPPGLVAKWLLSDLARRTETKGRKLGNR